MIVTGDSIREAFLSFFEGKGHMRMPSSSLIPAADPTLLLTNAGMVQFKPYFIGEMDPPNRRMTSVQKCFRTTDIDSVGDATHLTLFEMLGNFSVGDYFKKEAIEYGWEFVTGVLSLDSNRIWITIFTDDEESLDYWINVGVPRDRIKRFGHEDNFWGPAGKEGPCGPCSEIHYDFGIEQGCLKMDCGPNCTNLVESTGIQCTRFVELWNLVFMEYYQDEDGSRTELPSPNIDTGMGLERCAVIMQQKDNIYETDLFYPIVERICNLTGKIYGSDIDVDQAIRIVAEHCRSAVFLISDGVVPSNEGRGYVLRRLIRRAVRYANKLGVALFTDKSVSPEKERDFPIVGIDNSSFIVQLASFVIELNRNVYPDLLDRETFVLRVLNTEEERFTQVFDQGNGILGELIDYRKTVTDIQGDIVSLNLSLPGVETAGGSMAKDELAKQIATSSNIQITLAKWSSKISGSEAFIMYDTYGFPPELTEEMARENGLDGIDYPDFANNMEDQRNKGRSASSRFQGNFDKNRIYQQLDSIETSFIGYESFESESEVLAIIVNGKIVDNVSEGEELELIIKETPFYPEMGGQQGDTGFIYNDTVSLRVVDTQTPLAGLVVQQCLVVSGNLAVGSNVKSSVDNVRRQDTARNHSATHMLHAALREVLGLHVRQQGSMVTADRLRFDFTHLSSLTDEELLQVQKITNQKIRENLPVSSETTSYQEAINKGALAFFGDKYGNDVRVVSIDSGNNGTFSLEVCGGTHVRYTGDIGYCHIVSETGIGSGIRRIEALTGRAAEDAMLGQKRIVEAVSKRIQAAPQEIVNRLDDFVSTFQLTSRRINELERQLLKNDLSALVRTTIGESTLIKGELVVSSADLLREAGDWIKNEIESGIIVLGAILNDRPSLLVMATQDLVSKGFNSGDVIKEAATIVGGGGGGRPDIAQAGGKQPGKLKAALDYAEEKISLWLKTL